MGKGSMESSKILGDDGAEECQSSESGWTMYIGSPISDDEDDDASMKKNHDDDDDDHEYNIYDGSDDSMASDASSGPSHHLHQQQPCWDGTHGLVLEHDDHKEDKVIMKKQVMKKKKQKKTGFEASKETKEEECLVPEKRGIVTVQSGNKARFIGKIRK